MYRSQETVKNNANPPTTTDASDDLLMQEIIPFHFLWKKRNWRLLNTQGVIYLKLPKALHLKFKVSAYLDAMIIGRVEFSIKMCYHLLL